MEAAIQKMRAAGFTLTVVNGALRIAPADKLTEWQRAYIRKHKGAILEALQSQPANDYQPDAATASADPNSLENLHPYRIRLDDHAQLIWLEHGLTPEQVLAAAAERYGPGRVSLEPPSAGWPRLADIPELPAAVLSKAQVCCGDCQHFTPDTLGDGHRALHGWRGGKATA